jgi:hypothetical protein
MKSSPDFQDSTFPIYLSFYLLANMKVVVMKGFILALKAGPKNRSMAP